MSSNVEREAARSDRRSGKPTINDVARLSGVSKKTVSRVINRSPLLNEETRARVLAVIRELGYVPNPQARALALGTNFLIGLLHDSPNAQTVLKAQRGILEALQGSDYAMVVRPVDRGSPTLVDDVRNFLERQRPYGVLILPPLSENDAIARLCDELGCRYVRMGIPDLDDPERNVASNDRQAVAAAVDYLIARGHRLIALVTGALGYRLAAERRLGFEDAIAAAGLELPAGRIAEGNYTFESGIAAAEALLALSPVPTAIFASNDEMAAGIIHAVRSRGLGVPEDISVMGFGDNHIASRIWPPLTTVQWPIVAMARLAALKLLRETAHPEDEAEAPSILPSTLVERASVAGPPA